MRGTNQKYHPQATESKADPDRFEKFSFLRHDVGGDSLTELFASRVHLGDGVCSYKFCHFDPSLLPKFSYGKQATYAGSSLE